MESHVHRIECLNSELDKLQGLKDSLLYRKADLIREIADLDYYLDKKDEVTEALVKIQKDMQADTTGDYEKLLTELLHLVMPGDPANHRVVMSHYLKNNAVSLKTEIETEDGYRHDIYENKGQSVENILAICLRFLALGRTSNRRILLFDESDHGISPLYMGRFAQVIYELTYRIGMQVVYISHQDWKNFKGLARVIKLNRKDGLISSSILSEPKLDCGEEVDGEMKHYMNEVGITEVRLKNYKSHADTLVELSPFLNVIVGDMDLGKSSVIDAIDSLRKNKGSKSKIKNGQRYFSVELGMEEGRRLTWTYNTDHSKKSSYTLHDGNGNLIGFHEGMKGTPDFFDTYLSMGNHCGYDLHVADSHNSGFIFSKGISEARAADILSFDSETTQAQELLSRHKTNLSEYSRRSREAKRELNEVKNQLGALSFLNEIDRDGLIYSKNKILSHERGERAEQRRLSSSLHNLSELISCFERLEGVRGLSLERPPCTGVAARRVGLDIKQAEVKLLNLERLRQLLPFTQAKPQVSEARKHSNKIKIYSEKVKILSSIRLMEYPKRLSEKVGAEVIADEMLSLDRSIKKLSSSGSMAARDLESVKLFIREELHREGGICPYCSSKL